MKLVAKHIKRVEYTKSHICGLFVDYKFLNITNDPQLTHNIRICVLLGVPYKWNYFQISIMQLFVTQVITCVPLNIYISVTQAIKNRFSCHITIYELLPLQNAWLTSLIDNINYTFCWLTIVSTLKCDDYLFIIKNWFQIKNDVGELIKMKTKRGWHDGKFTIFPCLIATKCSITVEFWERNECNIGMCYLELPNTSLNNLC